MSDDLVLALRAGWGWTGIDPELVTAVSSFGHLIVRDRAGRFWYLDPELRSLVRVADDEAGLFRHMNQPEVCEVWRAEALTEQARARFGEPGEGRCYSLTPMALLRGDYAPDNFCTMSVAELIAFTGDFERQTRHLPDGATVQLKVTD